VITILIATAIIGVVFIVMMKEAWFAAHRTRWIAALSLPLSLPRYARSVGGKLMLAVSAKILLITVRILAVTIK